jgi:hypothetical protein
VILVDPILSAALAETESKPRPSKNRRVGGCNSDIDPKPYFVCHTFSNPAFKVFVKIYKYAYNGID